MRIWRLLLWFPIVALWAWVLVYWLPRGLRYWEIRRFSAQVEAVCTQGSGRLVLADLTDFDWDEVVILGPYVSRPWAAAALGYPWADYLDYQDLWTSDRYAALLFLKGGRIVRTQLHERRSGDFPYPMRRIARAAAVFHMDSAGKDCAFFRMRL